MDFSIPIEFTATRTSVMHGLASWFDLDFQAHASTRGEPTDALDQQCTASWDEYLASNSWPWLSTEPMNPNDQPPAPRHGVKVTLSTGPNAPRTHWQ